MKNSPQNSLFRSSENSLQVKKANTSTLYLMRHGEIATSGILAGKTDVLLSDLGWQQLDRATQKLPQINHCISSPLKRCALFAQHFSQQQQIPLIIEKSLQEMNFGDWDGKNYQALWSEAANDEEQAKISIGDFWQNPWQHAAPNGELMVDFVSRVDNWWQGWLNQQASGKTLVIAHGGVIKHLLARILALPIPGTMHMSAIDVPYASVIKVVVYHDEQGQHWPKVIF